MTNKLPVLSSVLYGEEDKAKYDGANVAPKVMTLKSLITPQTRHLFTINYNIITMPRRPARKL